MTRAHTNQLRLPEAPRSIAKGSTLKDLLGHEAIECLSHNISIVYGRFESVKFVEAALSGLERLSILQRGQHLANALHQFLPKPYEKAVEVLLGSLTPPLTSTDQLGLGVFFYLPHVTFVATYGLDEKFNDNRDPFETSMLAQYELTRRFSAEFSMRPFLVKWPERTLKRLLEWTRDSDPHVRRLCSEGSRPRLPWAIRIPAFIKDPRPTFPILEALKDDPELYVRRSVANHIGDIAKTHPELALELCERWLMDASPDRKWIVRHALRHPDKKGMKQASQLRKRAR